MRTERNVTIRSFMYDKTMFDYNLIQECAARKRVNGCEQDADVGEPNAVKGRTKSWCLAACPSNLTQTFTCPKARLVRAPDLLLHVPPA